jgi:hypothetical protein
MRKTTARNMPNFKYVLSFSFRYVSSQIQFFRFSPKAERYIQVKEWVKISLIVIRTSKDFLADIGVRSSVCSYVGNEMHLESIRLDFI